MITMHKTDEYIQEALRSGASGYILKESGHDELRTAIRTVLQGKVYLSPDVSARVVSNMFPAGGRAAPVATAAEVKRRPVLEDFMAIPCPAHAGVSAARSMRRGAFQNLDRAASASSGRSTGGLPGGRDFRHEKRRECAIQVRVLSVGRQPGGVSTHGSAETNARNVNA